MASCAAITNVHAADTKFGSGSGTETIPLSGTAEIVLGTNHVLAGRSIATDALIAGAAIANTITAVNLAGEAVFSQLRLANIVAAAITAVIRAIFTVFVAFAHVIATFNDDSSATT